MGSRVRVPPRSPSKSLRHSHFLQCSAAALTGAGTNKPAKGTNSCSPRVPRTCWRRRDPDDAPLRIALKLLRRRWRSLGVTRRFQGRGHLRDAVGRLDRLTLSDAGAHSHPPSLSDLPSRPGITTSLSVRQGPAVAGVPIKNTTLASYLLTRTCYLPINARNAKVR
jgi:hypothetical protein